jgi:hypothetical protein
MNDQYDWLIDDVDADRQTMPKDTQVSTLEELVRRMENLEKEIEIEEARLTMRRKQLQELMQDIIPDKMIEMGVKKLVLSDGMELSYKPFYNGKVLKDEGYAWLEQAGYPGAVKQELKLETSRIDSKILDSVREFVMSQTDETNVNLSLKEKLSVHHMTLGALVKELNKQGKTLPSDLFEVYIGNQAVLKKGKAHGQ